MKIKELDVVRLKDGRTATVLEVFGQGADFLIEIADDKGRTIDITTVSCESVEAVTYTA